MLFAQELSTKHFLHQNASLKLLETKHEGSECVLGVLHDNGKLSNFSIIYFKLSNFPCDLHVLLLAYI